MRFDAFCTYFHRKGLDMNTTTHEQVQVEAVSDFERTLARNLRQPSSCGKAMIQRMLDDSDPAAEEQLAAFIAQSGGLGIRENEAGLLVQLRVARDDATLCRRALETLAGNSHFAPANYPAELRQILTAALGRPY
jgi:hypothetical protein